MTQTQCTLATISFMLQAARLICYEYFAALGPGWINQGDGYVSSSAAVRPLASIGEGPVRFAEELCSASRLLLLDNNDLAARAYVLQVLLLYSKITVTGKW